ncbi:patatin-like phospholipase family protein [Aquisalimonas sp.]|uniref:patatin-like phospholipase family protein n=1 Tax=Aquisalimonas sp. TaxID=1872621 RepID=UPI0025C6E8CF|nr:patatin-like phospholipase family protein [Aquisalimonas sp.]
MAEFRQPVLRFLAGPGALARIRDGGLAPSQVAGLVGAAGGPKWLALNHLDRALFAHWLPGTRTAPRFLIGSSIATWRFACAAQADPEAAFQRFEDAYMAQRYSTRPDSREISGEARRILGEVLGHTGADEILGNTALQLNVMAVRGLGLTGSRNRHALTAGLAGAGLANMMARRTLGSFFERVLFHHPAGRPPLGRLQPFPLQETPLSADNLTSALLASGSIPTVMEPEIDIPGAGPGLYQDGGLLDYQMDLPYATGDNVVLFPHYEARVVPGWFDKLVPWRRPQRSHMDNVLVVAPTEEWIAGLPGGKVPNRKDFYRYAGDDATRIEHWQAASEATRALADDFMEAVASGAIRSRVEPLAVGR